MEDYSLSSDRRNDAFGSELNGTPSPRNHGHDAPPLRINIPMPPPQQMQQQQQYGYEGIPEPMMNNNNGFGLGRYPGYPPYGPPPPVPHQHHQKQTVSGGVGWKVSRRHPPSSPFQMPVPPPMYPPVSSYPEQHHPYPPPPHYYTPAQYVPDPSASFAHEPYPPFSPEMNTSQAPLYPPTHLHHGPPSSHSNHPTSPFFPPHQDLPYPPLAGNSYPMSSPSISRPAIYPLSPGTTVSNQKAPPPPPFMPMPIPMPIPVPTGVCRYQAFQPQMPYPPPNYIRPPSQDFISLFRSSTVKSSMLSEAEEDLKRELSKPLGRYDSLKYSTSSSDVSTSTSDTSDYEDTASELQNQEEDSEQRRESRRPTHLHKPLPPKPPTGPESTDPALLSIVSRRFSKEIKEVVSLRHLSFSDEYPNAFTGQEAVDTMMALLQERYVGHPHLREHCLGLLNSMMASKPFGLIEPVDASKERGRRIVYDSADETYRLRAAMTVGIFTPLTQCYVQNCKPGDGGCYAPRCPNKPDVMEKEMALDPLLRSVSIRSTLSRREGMLSTETWGERMDPDFYATVDPHERSRQEAINEIIFGEEQYLRDMQVLHNVIVKPLRESCIIDPAQWDLFSKSVFNNHEEIQTLSQGLFEDLLDVYQEYEDTCNPGIGRILLRHFERFRDPYLVYIPNVHLAEYIVSDQKRSNPKFNEFLQLRMTDPSLNKQSFRHFLIRPVIRLPRYALLVQTLIKKTDKESPEYDDLIKCNELITELAKLCDQYAAGVKNRVEILLLNNALYCRQGESFDLKLTDPKRKIYYRGDLKYEGSTIHERLLHIIIFDHLVLITKPRGETHEERQYKIWRRPIPLQMLHVHGADNQFSLPTSSQTISNAFTNSTHCTYTNLLNSAALRSTTHLSLILTSVARNGGSYVFSCNNVAEKKRWIHAFNQANADIKSGEDVVNVISIESAFFRLDKTSTSTFEGNGKVMSTVPFSGPDNKAMVAIGTTSGVYFKTMPDGPVRPVLSLKNVTQLEVMQSQQLLLVLSNKVLFAYPLDEVTSQKSITPGRSRQVVADPVHFFQTGVCHKKEQLVVARFSKLSTFFTVYLPTRASTDKDDNGSITKRRHHRLSHFGRFGRHDSNSTWFTHATDFMIGAYATTINFLNTKLAVVCEKTIEIIDPEHLRATRSVIDEQLPEFGFIQQYKTGLKPMAMYRVDKGKRFLICYNKFVFCVDNKQNLVRAGKSDKWGLLCKWECHAERIVLLKDYIVAFDQRLIEVRDIHTGKLVQIIPGDDCRLTYYNEHGPEGPVLQGCIVHKNNPNFQDIFSIELNKHQDELDDVDDDVQL